MIKLEKNLMESLRIISKNFFKNFFKNFLIFIEGVGLVSSHLPPAGFEQKTFYIMKTSEANAMPNVHRSNYGRMGQADPSVAMSVPVGVYKVGRNVKQAPPIVKGGNPYNAIQLIDGDSSYFVGLSKFRGYGWLNKKLTKLVETGNMKDLESFLVSEPTIEVTASQAVEVDRYNPGPEETATVTSNFPIWKQIEDKKEE